MFVQGAHAIPVGKLSEAAAGGPPSPLEVGAPVPARVVMIGPGQPLDADTSSGTPMQAVHAAEVFAPARVLYAPAAQAVHEYEELDPITSLYEPALQAEHVKVGVTLRILWFHWDREKR